MRLNLLLLSLLVACAGNTSSQEQGVQTVEAASCQANVPDPRACDPTDTKKTTVCHIPPGNPGNAHTICVGNSAVPAHLDHGDFLGTCICPGGGSDTGSNGGSDTGSNSGSDTGSNSGSNTGSNSGSNGGSNTGSNGGSGTGSNAGSGVVL
jgi:hypothetical protein